MKIRIATLVCALLAILSVTAAEGEWLTDFEKAKAKAREENKLMMLDFTGSDWCGACIALKKDVFTKPEFKEYAAKNLVLVEVDFPSRKKLPGDLAERNEKLKERYKIKYFPTLLFLDAEGKVVGKEEGYAGGGVKSFIKSTDKILAKAKKS